MKTCVIILGFVDCVLPQCLCKLLLALAVYIVQCTIYIVQPQYIVQRILYIIQLYSAYRTLTLHNNIYFLQYT